MRITKRQLKRIIKEEIAHPRYGLGKNVADVDFPIVVGFDGTSIIAYNRDELDDILDSAGDTPYSLNSLHDMEPETKPVGRGIERYIESKEGESAPFGSGMEQANLEPDQKEIVGHT